MKRLSLRAKFIVLILVLLSVLFALVAFILVRVNTATLRTRLLNESQAFAALATKPIGDAFGLYKDSGKVRILQQVERFTDFGPNISNVAIVGLDGKTLFSQHDVPADITAEAAGSLEPAFHYEGGQLTRIIYPYVEDFGAHRYSVVYDVSGASIEAAISKLVGAILIFSLLALVASAIITFGLVNHWFLNPIRHVSQAALVISAGNLSQQITLERNHDEISDLASSVNTMANALKADIAKLKEADEMKSEFMMIASHNLRTPLTVMNGYLEAIRSLELSPEASKMIDSITASNRQLGIMAEDILTISSIEAGQQVIVKGPADVVETLRPLATEFDVLARQKGLVFTANLPTMKLPAELSVAHFRAAVWNLLDNALKFTETGGHVNLRVQPSDQAVQIIVSDSGVGIEQAEMPKLFTKFHRGTSILQYNYTGVGIGLYITKLIVEQHGGHVAVVSQAGQGTTFTITIPLRTISPPAVGVS